jgi:hypothetical protein
MSQAEWQALFSKSTFIETGMQPHIATEIAKWADGPDRLLPRPGRRRRPVRRSRSRDRRGGPPGRDLEVGIGREGARGKR